MGKFNTIDTNPTKVETHEGGTAYLKSIENEWTNMLFSFVLQAGNDSFYETVDDKENRFVELTDEIISKYGPQFAAKAAVFTRNELGLRSVSELLAALLNKENFEGKRKFYADYFKRPDGVGEVFAAVDYLGMKKSHALIRGCGDYLSGLSEYQIGKYKMSKRKYNMFDLINLTHANSEAIDKYKRGTLASPDTWEVAISTAEDEDSRSQEWIRLVTEEKLGYLALIRNLRNILNADGVTESWVKEVLIPQITNKDKILKSLTFPYQIYVAYLAVKDSCPFEVMVALSDAFKISALSTMPSLPGNNVIVVDVSGSMNDPYSTNSQLSIVEVSAVYAVALYLSNNKFDMIKFGSQAMQVEYPKLTNVFSLIDKFSLNEALGYGTEINPVFDILDKNASKETCYDRIFIFSDMQVMAGANSWFTSDKNTANSRFESYAKMSPNAHVYSFDLGNYRSQLVSNHSKISYVTTVSNKIFEIIQYLDNPEKSLIDVIKDYNY